MTLSERQQLFSKILGDFLVWIYAQGNLGVTLGDAHRPPELQEMYVKQGKSKTTDSRHISRLAIDLNLFVGGKYSESKEDYRTLGEEWERECKFHGLEPEWGGRFGVSPDKFAEQLGWDCNHFGVKL